MATNFKIHREYCNYLKLHFLLQTGPRLYLGINLLALELDIYSLAHHLCIM